MGLIVYILLIVLGIRFPKSQRVTFAIIIFMIVMFSFVERDGDYQQYQYVYESFDKNWLNVYEPGFVLILWFCKTIGLTYSLFRLFIGSLFLFGLYRSIKMQTENTAFVLALVLIFPFFYFVSALRSAVAMGLVLNAIPYLQDSSWRGVLKYVSIIIVAALFHVSSLIYLAFLLTHIKLTKKIVAVYSAVTIIYGIVLHYTDWISNLLSLVTQNPKILQWFTDNASTANFTGSIAVLLIFAAFVLTACQAARICKNSTGVSMASKKYATLIANLSILMLFAYPLFIFSTVFMRQLYLILPCVIISCANTAFLREHMKRQPLVGSFLKKTSGIPASIPFNISFILGLGVVLLCAFYFDLPYLKQGQSMFDELIYLPKFW